MCTLTRIARRTYNTRHLARSHCSRPQFISGILRGATLVGRSTSVVFCGERPQSVMATKELIRIFSAITLRIFFLGNIYVYIYILHSFTQKILGTSCFNVICLIQLAFQTFYPMICAFFLRIIAAYENNLSRLFLLKDI